MTIVDVLLMEGEWKPSENTRLAIGSAAGATLAGSALAMDKAKAADVAKELAHYQKYKNNLGSLRVTRGIKWGNRAVGATGAALAAYGLGKLAYNRFGRRRKKKK